MPSARAEDGEIEAEVEAVETAASPDAGPAAAPSGITVYQDDEASIRVTLQAAVAALSVRNAGLGAGTRSRRDGSMLRNPTWADGYIKPGVAVTLSPAESFHGSLYAGLSAITGWTLGDGDAYALSGGALQATWGGTSHTDMETLYAGWRSGTGAGKSADGLDLSVGRQEFVIGDGFLIGDGHYDRGKDAGYYSGGRQAWSGSTVASAALLPLRADAFWLKGDKNSGSSSILGVNAELTDGALGTLGASVLRVMGDNEAESGYAGRRGLKVWSARFQGTPVPDLPEVFVAAEWGLQTNEGRGGTRKRANAWYAEIGYTWSGLGWKPSLSVRHARFGGDKAGSASDEAWDPLRYSSTRGWGTWFMGEIVGQYMLFNSNEDVDMLHAKAQPLDDVTIGALGYVFQYDRTAGVSRWDGGTGVADRHFGNELDAYVDWAPRPWLSLSLMAGLFTPGDGARQAYGASKSSQLVGTIMSLKF